MPSCRLVELVAVAVAVAVGVAVAVAVATPRLLPVVTDVATYLEQVSRT